MKEHQERLTEIMSDAGPTALLEALDSFRELRAEAPSDISDEWQQVIRSIEALEQALDDAGVDPADFDSGKPPEGVSKEEQRGHRAGRGRGGVARRPRWRSPASGSRRSTSARPSCGSDMRTDALPRGSASD